MVFCAKLDVTVNAGVFSCFIRYMHYSSSANVFRQLLLTLAFIASVFLPFFGVLVRKGWVIMSSMGYNLVTILL